MLNPDPSLFFEYGKSVDMENDDFIVGAPATIVNGVNQGGAYVYLWNGSTYDEHFLTPSNGMSGDRFGNDVGISGNRVIVGAPHNDALGNNTGCAYIFDYDGTTWTETIIHSNSSNPNSFFGWSVDISGNRAVAGAPFDEQNGGTNSGRAFIFNKVGPTWTETFIADYGTFQENVGWTVGIDGTRCVVGHNNQDLTSYLEYESYEEVGGAWAFSSIYGIFEELMGPTDIDGNLIILGGDEQAHIFCSSCPQAGELIASDSPTNSNFGDAVAISGNRAIVGAPSDDTGDTNNGAVYVFDYDGSGNWSSTKFFASNDFDDNLNYGQSVGIGNDRMIVGTTSPDGGVYLNDCSGAPFVTTWLTTTPNESIEIPTFGGGYNYDIDWGDGSTDSGVNGNATHTYATAGTYQVRIVGNFPRIYFNNTGDKDKLMSIDSWGSISWFNMTNAFYGCSNMQLLATDAPFLNNVLIMTSMFRDCSSMNGPVGHWDISNVTKLNNTFNGASSFNQDLSLWNTSRVNSMIATFRDASSFNQPLASWNTFLVNNMNSMFQNASSFNQDISSWSTGRVGSMNSMFRDASSFDQNLSSWDFLGLQSANSMFANVQLSTANYDALLASLSTTSSHSNVALDGGLSNYCQSAPERTHLINDHNWTITDGGQSNPCNNGFITTWEIAAGESITIPTIGGGYNYNIDWGDGQSDNNLTGNAMHTYTSSGIYEISISANFPRIYFNNSGDKDKIIAIDNWGEIEWSSMSNAFKGCSNLQILATDEPNLTQCTNMFAMFKGCSSMNADISGWDVSNISRMEFLFEDASSFDQDLCGWNTSNVTNMKAMFDNATSFDQDLSCWSFENVTDMSNMFANVQLSTANYDALLISIGVGIQQANITFDGGLSNYCASLPERGYLINTRNWTITDGGTSSSCTGLNDFIVTWSAFAGGGLTIPTNGSGYNYTVDWGDGQIDTNQTGDASHSYQATGIYTISISGDFPRIYFNNRLRSDRLRTIQNWGNIKWTNMSNAFRGCTNLQIIASDAPDLSQCRNMIGMFDACSSMNSNIDHWDVSNIERMEFLFQGASSFNQSLCSWNTSNVTKMNGMFEDATSFDQDLSCWSYSNVTDMSDMFRNSDLSNAHYEALLQLWACGGQINANVPFHGGDAQYCQTEGSRQALIDHYNWVITDGGIDVSCSAQDMTRTWLGLNTEWFDCGNWSEGYMPSESSDVIIDVAPFYPLLTAGKPVYIKTLDIRPLAEIEVCQTCSMEIRP